MIIRIFGTRRSIAGVYLFSSTYFNLVFLIIIPNKFRYRHSGIESKNELIVSSDKNV